MSDELKIQLLGTSAAVPTEKRGLPSLALIHDSGTILFDMGEGTQMRIRQAGLAPFKIHTILISHLHGDHIFGLPGFITSQQMIERSAPLTVIGPPGIRQLFECIQNVSGFEIFYPLVFIELDSQSETPFQAGPFTVTALPLEHRNLCFGYRLVEPPKPGKFSLEKAELYNIPFGPLRGELQQGRSIVIKGKTITPEMVLGPERPGRTVVYCTDTRPCENANRLAKGADILIFDSTFIHEMSERAFQTFHSTSVQAAQVAAAADVRLLVLSHISMRNTEADETNMLKEACKIFHNTLLPRDLDIIEIFRNEPAAQI